MRSRFVEHMPTGLVLTYRDGAGLEAELLVTLDVFEMLQRLTLKFFLRSTSASTTCGC